MSMATCIAAPLPGEFARTAACRLQWGVPPLISRRLHQYATHSSTERTVRLIVLKD